MRGATLFSSSRFNSQSLLDTVDSSFIPLGHPRSWYPTILPPRLHDVHWRGGAYVPQKDLQGITKEMGLAWIFMHELEVTEWASRTNACHRERKACPEAEKLDIFHGNSQKLWLQFRKVRKALYIRRWSWVSILQQCWMCMWHLCVACSHACVLCTCVHLCFYACVRVLWWQLLWGESLLGCLFGLLSSEGQKMLKGWARRRPAGRWSQQPRNID